MKITKSIRVFYKAFHFVIIKLEAEPNCNGKARTIDIKISTIFMFRIAPKWLIRLIYKD